jgi:VIT1/CCC1 family predicted Fe2+/Mn2+ transporter
MSQLYRNEGMSAEDADRIASTLARYPRAYAHAMVSLELGLQLDPQTVRIPEALTMGISYILGSIFPLAAYFFLPVPEAIPVSLVLTFVALVIIGTIKGKLAQLNIVRSIAEIVVVAAVSAGGGYLLGTFIPQWLGY